MRWWLVVLDDLIFPILLACVLAALGTLPLKEALVFLPAAETVSTLVRRYAPLEKSVARIIGPLFAPIPALLLVWSLFPGAELLEVGRMLLHWVLYLAYAALMAFVMPLLEALSGAPERYPEE